MKTLKDYSNKLLTGKHINEGLFVKSNKPINQHQLEFKVPKFEDGEIYHEEAGIVTIPRKRYFVYFDAYRGLPHLGSIDDMLYNIGMNWIDYEDYVNKGKLVLYADDNYKNVLKWIFEEFFDVPVPTKKDVDNIEKYIDKYENKFYKNGSKKMCDEIYVLCEFYLGKDIIPVEKDFDLDDENAIYSGLEQFFGYAD